MGLGGMSIGSLILIFLVVLLVFGTKRLRNVGEDIGAAVKSFRKGLQDTEQESAPTDTDVEPKDKPADS